MKKIRSWPKRLTRSTTRKKEQQEQTLLGRAMSTPQQQQQQQRQQQHQGHEQPAGAGGKTLSVFINDFTDPDNQAAALLWANFLAEQPGLKGIYVAEPRHVRLGEFVDTEDFKACLDLVAHLKKAQPAEEQDPTRSRTGIGRLDGKSAIGIMLAGLMTDEIISEINDRGRELTPEERRLLEYCVMATEEETFADRLQVEKDAIKHAQLLLMDYLTTMKTVPNVDFETYLDHKCLSSLGCPINLKLHSHDELIFRTAGELENYKGIVGGPGDIEKKATALRSWYQEAIERKLKNDFQGQQPWEDLKEYGTLFDKMDQYDRVVVFGGCSLTLLDALLKSTKHQRLIEKVEYYQQGGTCDSSMNILGNPLNFLLNYEAAQSTCENAQKLKKFMLIPTDTTKMFKFTVRGLTQWSAPVGLHALIFYGKEEAWNLIAPEERQHTSPSTADMVKWRAMLVLDNPRFKDSTTAPIADLVAFLAALTDVFKDYLKPADSVFREVDVKMNTNGDTGEMLLEKYKPSDIKAFMFEHNEPFSKEPESKELVPLLVEDTSTLVQEGIYRAHKLA